MTAGDRARALAFLAGVSLVRDVRPGRPILLRGSDASLGTADLYRPTARMPSATVLFVHGMSLRAHRDPRVIAACNALAAAGLQVVAPRIAGLCDLEMDPEIPTRIADILLGCSADPALGCPDRVGIVSASFAAGLCLKAAARAEVERAAGALLLVGTYVDAQRLLLHLLTSPGADPFGRLILLRAFLRSDPGVPRRVLDAMDAALADESLRGDPRLPGVLASLPADDRHTFERLRDDPEEGARLAARIATEHRAEIDAFSALEELPYVAAPVVLVHGRQDRVIPPSESADAATLLDSYGVPCRHLATSLVDHGDLSSPVRQLGEAPRVIEVLGYWFGALRRASATIATVAHVASSTTNGQYSIR